MVSVSCAIFSSFSMQALQYAMERLPEILDQGIPEDVLQASVRFLRAVVFPPSRGQPEALPSGCPVACPFEPPLRIDKGFEPDEGMTIQVDPSHGISFVPSVREGARQGGGREPRAG